jgi:hypothetical protein
MTTIAQLHFRAKDGELNEITVTRKADSKLDVEVVQWREGYTPQSAKFELTPEQASLVAMFLQNGEGHS